ncbi:MAG: DUF2163 domain-containing protein [Alphaproteobacteria bacterium]
MKKLSPSLNNHLSSEVTTLATCWKLSLTSGKILGFTDCDIDIIYEGVTYKACSGFTASCISSTMSLAIDNFQIEAALNHDQINEEDILQGMYDYSEVEIFMVNYLNPSQGRVFLNKGYFGEITLNQGKFTVEVKSITQKLDKLLGNIYSPICRAKFGDSKCKINKNLLARKGTISAITSPYSFIDNARNEEKGYFNFGTIKFTSGEYLGRECEVKDFIGNQILLSLPMSNYIKIGDEYIIFAGCDGSFVTCKKRYKNSINFRGEPHIPGNKYMYSTSSTVTS